MAAVAVRLLVPRIPMILKTALLHSLSLTEESGIWDVRTALIVATLRSILTGSSRPYEEQQQFSVRDLGVRGRLWVSKVTFPAPDDSFSHPIFDVIDQLKEHHSDTYSKPGLIPVEAEWTGFRYNARAWTPEPNLSEEEKYSRLMDETTSDITIVYFHGGGFSLLDPCTYRATTSRLAGLVSGRVLSVRYRLSPQHPFPAALLDCLVAYLSLVYPPKGSSHESIDPCRIVLAGDSAGGNLALALTILILRLQKTNRTVQWHGRDVDIPLPAGVATNSAWIDITGSMPSVLTNAHFDYLSPPLNRLRSSDPVPPDPPACSIWPATPPRAAVYCDGNMICHPLVSPLAATPEMFRGSPPIFFCCGDELLEDEVKIVAQKCHRAGVKVRFEKFEAMPHCFAILVQLRSPRSPRCFQGWARFMQKATKYASNGDDEESLELSGGCWIEHKTGEEKEVDLDTLTSITDDEVKRLMQGGKENMIKAFEAKLSKRESKL